MESSPLLGRPSSDAAAARLAWESEIHQIASDAANAVADLKRELEELKASLKAPSPSPPAPAPSPPTPSIASGPVAAEHIGFDGNWLNGPPGNGYSAPKLEEALPSYLLSDQAQKYISANGDMYVTWNTKSVIKWAMYQSISRKLADRALQNITGYNQLEPALPYRALWEDELPNNPERIDTNAPQEYFVPWLQQARSAILTPWLGCRASWPCTQFCWYNCLSCGLHQYAAIVWSIITIAFEFTLLDAMVVEDFIAKVPDKITDWEDYYYLDKPIAARLATLFIYFVFPWFVVGFLWGSSSGVEGNLHSYYNGIYQTRIVLRSMAARPEANTYGYCTALFWAVLVEFHTVIIPAYLPFLAPALILQHYEGNLREISKLYIVFQVILSFEEYSLYLLEFLFCFTPVQIKATTLYVAGIRAKREWCSIHYLYLWVLAITVLLLIVLCKWRLSMLYLWFIPINVTIYGFVVHSLPYCLHGMAVCPPHAGPAVALMGISTLVVFVLGYLFCKGCFLFPCFCAPEVPGWIFFPPQDPPPNPLQGDLDYDSFVIMFSKAMAGFPHVDDCVWTPPTSMRGR